MWCFLVLCAIAAAVAKAEVSTRIVGGQEATYGDHPYICSLQADYIIFRFHICGCVIYNQNTIVTAAHCVDGQSAGLLRIVAGLHRMSQTDQYEQARSIASFRMHPNWSPNGAGYPNDIATIRLSTPLTFNSHVNTIQFAESGNFTGKTCTLSGWGRLQGGGATATTLMKVAMTKISNDDCASRWASVSGAAVNDGHICFFELGKSACNGDSGGPVRCDDILTGITSWGLSTCAGSHPSVYTRVSYFSKWIADNSY